MHLDPGRVKHHSELIQSLGLMDEICESGTHLNPPFFRALPEALSIFLLQKPSKNSQKPDMLVMLLLRLEKDVNISLIGRIH